MRFFTLPVFGYTGYVLTLPFLLLFQSLSARADGVRFVQNKGQWPTEILYRADLPGGFLFLKKQSLHYVFYDAEAVGAYHTSGGNATARTAFPPAGSGIRAHGVEVELQNSRPEVRIEPSKLISQNQNFFLGNDPSRWAAAVPSFAEVLYRDIYPGIDMRVFAYYQTLKYEFMVRPGADPSLIRLAYQGASGVRTDGEQLVVETSLMPFKEDKPYCFSDQNGKSVEVPSRWQLDGATARFQLPQGYNNRLPLTIDPELVFSTYSGAGSDNWGHTATYDAAGNLYTAGVMFGAGFTATRGAFQVQFGGELDVEIMKFNPDGSQLLYSAFLGGSTGETPNSLIVNSKGELIVYGVTSSSNFPFSPSAYGKKFMGGNRYTPVGNQSPANGVVQGIYFANGTDLFVTKISPDGSTLQGSTFVGGSGNDGINDILNNLNIRNYGDDLRGEVIVDAQDNVYVASVTYSDDFPTTAGVSQRQLRGRSDAVVLQLSPDLSQLRWSTYYGGSGYDVAYGLRQGPSGAVYITGVTHSADLSATTGALKPALGGSEDGFLAKLVNGTLQRSTYLGTDADDAAYLVDLDAAENPHVFGLSRGRYPVTENTYRVTGGSQFIHALDANLSRTVFSTVFGSGRATPDISPTAFLVNECGNIYVSGWGGIVNSRAISNFSTSTRGLPVTADAYRKTTTGNNYWLAVLEKEAKSLLYGTFFGSDSLDTRGDHVDGGTCRFDKSGVIYHAACACGGSHFPATAQAWSKTNRSSNCNNAAFKFSIDRLLAAFDTYEGSKKGVIEGCAPLALNFVNTSEGGKDYEWDFGGRGTSKNPAQVAHTFDKPGEYTVTLKAYNKLTCKQVDVAQQIIKVFPSDFKLSADTTVCPGKPVQLLAQGAKTYTWSPAQGLSGTAIANPVATVEQTTQFTVTMTNEQGCTSRKSVSVKVDDSFKPLFDIRSNSDCGQSTKLDFLNRSQGGQRYRWTMGNGDTLQVDSPGSYQYSRSGQYQVTLTSYKNGCEMSFSLPIDVENLSEIPNVVTANNDGKNDVFTVGFTGAQLEIYNRWGRPVYQSANYPNDWGPRVPHGTYYYLLTTPRGVKCKGWVEVLE